SRRRHTRFSRDWSSDVCSSDLGVVSEELELAPDHRDRRAELVSRVVDEATLRGKRLLEPVEHLVEGPGEATDLVVTFHWYPLAQIGRASCREREWVAVVVGSVE